MKHGPYEYYQNISKLFIPCKLVYRIKRNGCCMFNSQYCSKHKNEFYPIWHLFSIVSDTLDQYVKWSEKVSMVLNKLLTAETGIWRTFSQNLDLKEAKLGHVYTSETKMESSLYVDHGLVASSNLKESEKFINDLKSKYEITTKPVTIHLSWNSLFVNKLVAKQFFKSLIWKTAEQYLILCLNKTWVKKKLTEQSSETFPYTEAVNALIYLMIGTRPVLAYYVVKKIAGTVCLYRRPHCWFDD